MLNDNDNPPGSGSLLPYLFIDLESGKEYNLSIPSERIRLRNDLVEKGFFKNENWQHMYEWFSMPRISPTMFNEFLEALRFYNTILNRKKKGKINAE